MTGKANDRKPLTNDLVSAIEAPESGAITVWDSDPKARGFGVRVYAGGARSFFINYRVDGRERRHTIGAFPLWSASAARERARDLRKEIDAGGDPQGEKRERRDAPTVKDLIDRYITEHLPRKASTGARGNDERRMLAEIAKHLGPHTKVADVHGGDIKAMHRAITDSGRPVRANRILAVASKAFSLALVPMAGETRPWRNAVDGNPCRGIERNHEEPKGRLYTASELAAISDALLDYQGIAADAVRLMMMTGARPSEVMKAQWSEFDAEPGVWSKPSAHTKQRKTHRLPLSPPAIQLIERLRAERTGPYLFPGRPGEPIAALWHCWHFVRDRSGLPKDARLYDLRHTFATLGATGGLSLPIIGKLLGHTTTRTTQRYAGHLADDPLREAASKIVNMIAPPNPGREPVPLPRGRRP